jgi:hypothetical protein
MASIPQIPYIVIASDQRERGNPTKGCCEDIARGNLTRSVILSVAKNLIEILRALPSG